MLTEEYNEEPNLRTRPDVLNRKEELNSEKR